MTMNRTGHASIESIIQDLMRTKMIWTKAIDTQGRGIVQSIQEGITRMHTNISTGNSPRIGSIGIKHTVTVLQKMSVAVLSQGISIGMILTTLKMSIGVHVGTRGTTALVPKGNTRMTEIPMSKLVAVLKPPKARRSTSMDQSSPLVILLSLRMHQLRFQMS
jgi:hypothetical protein